MRKRAGVLASSTILFPGRIITSFVQLVYVSLITHHLNAQSAGTFFIAFSLIKVVTALADLALDDGIVRFIAKFEAAGDLGRVRGVALGGLVIGGLASCALAAVLAVLSPLVAHRMASASGILVPVLRILAFSVPFFVLFWLATAGLQALHKIVAFTFLRDFLQPSLMLIGSFVVLIYQPTVVAIAWVYVGSVVASACIAMLLLWRQLRSMPPAPVVRCDREIVRFSAPLMFGNLFRAGGNWMDPVILGVVLPAAQISIYFTAQRASLLLMLALGAANLAISPWVAHLSASNNKVELRRILTVSLDWVMLASLPMFVLMVLFRKEVVTVMGSHNSTVGASVLLALSIGQLINAGTGSVARVLILSGNQKVEFVNTVMHTLLNAIGLMVGVKLGGLIGAAIGSAVVITVINAAKIVEVWLLLGVHPYTRRFILILGISVFAGYVAFFTRSLMHESGFGVLIQVVVVSASFILPYLALLSCFAFNPKQLFIRLRPKSP